MRAEFSRQGWKEFNQRYLGTFGWFEKEDKSSLLVKVEHVSSEEIKFVDKHSIRYYSYPDRGNVFTFIPVVKGLYYIGDEIVCVKRVPARQYRRGICQENTVIETLPKLNSLGITFSNLESIFDVNKPPILGINYRIFNNLFAFIEGKVYLYDVCIGNYSTQSETIQLFNKLFHQEIVDIVNTHSLGMFVEIKQ